MRWYELRRDAQKLGWIRVVWAPSVWEGRPTVRDATTIHTREVRDMDGTEDVFEHETAIEVERGDDGTLWWMRSVVTEATQATTSELTWQGSGYRLVERQGETVRDRMIPADAPAHVDAEAFLAQRARTGRLSKGDRFVLRVLEADARRVAEHPLEVLGPEPGPGPGGEVPCTKVRQTSPERGDETLLWIDAEGSVARVRDVGAEIVRVSEESALERPARTATFSITTPSFPALQRVFAADRLELDLHVAPADGRPLPELPESPWSRTVSVEGDAEKGAVLRLELRRHDAPGAKARIPVRDPAFARDLEGTLLMQVDHPEVRAAAAMAVGGEKDARRAVARLAAFVFGLEKKSPLVAQASAVDILRQRCGDCSEHALLFVTLCRAAGIPARRCSGWVCVGDSWGSHSWAEVWTGAWIGADPTTNDVGTAARYVFFGYPDDGTGRSDSTSARARGRLRFVARVLEEGEDRVPLDDPAAARVVDEKARVARHRLAGIDLRGWPEDWFVTLSGDAQARVVSPAGTASVRVIADQGHRSEAALRTWTTGEGESDAFAGLPALRLDVFQRVTWLVPSRGRVVIVDARSRSSEREAFFETLQKVLALTFAPKPPPR